MRNLLKFLLLTLLVVGFTMPSFGKVEAAKIAVLPVVTNEDEENYAVSRRVWNEQCMQIFKFPEFDMVDDSDLTIVLNKVNFNTVAKDGVNESLLRQVMSETKADMGIMLVLDELSLEPEIPPTVANNYRLTQKGDMLLVNNISCKVKKVRINEQDDYDYAVTVRNDFVHDQLRNTITRELKSISKAK
jgi:hypothetical protein